MSDAKTLDTIQNYNNQIRKDLDPTSSDASDPGNDAQREEELGLFRRKLDYQKVSNDKLTLQLSFFEKLITYVWFIVVIIAIALPFPTYQRVNKQYIGSVLLFCLMIYMVKHYYLLSFEVYFINMYHYVQSRFNGSVYHPYLVYGFIN